MKGELTSNRLEERFRGTLDLLNFDLDLVNPFLTGGDVNGELTAKLPLRRNASRRPST